MDKDKITQAASSHDHEPLDTTASRSRTTHGGRHRMLVAAAVVAAIVLAGWLLGWDGWQTTGAVSIALLLVTCGAMALGMMFVMGHDKTDEPKQGDSSSDSGKR